MRIQQISKNPSSHVRIGENTCPTSCVSMAHKRREKDKSEQPDTGIYRIKFMSGQDHRGMGQWWGEAWGPFLAYWLDSESPPQDQWYLCRHTGMCESSSRNLGWKTKDPAYASVLRHVLQSGFYQKKSILGFIEYLYWVIKSFFLPFSKEVLMCMPHLLEPKELSPRIVSVKLEFILRLWAF